MAILNKKQILEAPDIKTELVPVPEWGGEVYVKGMSGAERDQFEGSLIQQRGKAQRMNLENIRAKLASLTICDKDGKRLFSEADVKALSEKSAGALQRIFTVAQKLSGISDSDVDELVEGLKSDPFDDSPSD